MPIRFLGGLAASLALTTAVFADTSDVDPKQLSELAASSEWLALGHYHSNRFTSGHTSQADDPSFFLSERGKTDPKAELRATVQALTQPVTGDHNSHPRCEFPARDRWLQSRLDLEVPEVDCSEFEAWKSELNTESVTLVFAASYLNSPSSMFGHTFLRLDPPKNDGETNLLLANTISYAADAAERDSEILFAYRGIFGGYPGITSVRPYYEMVRLYSDIENRDLWEYHLNLTTAEVEQMLAHAWEIRDRNFDYYFFDENCSYRLLALIDVARPGTDLLDEVSTHAIPTDTVRWVMKHDLVESISYRPSAATQVSHTLDQLPGQHKRLAAAIANGYVDVDGEEMEALEQRERALVLDATYDYVRYQAQAEGWPRKHAAPLSHDLLVARSQLENQPPPTSPPRPEIRDDQGHQTFRAGLGAGYSGDRHYLEVSLRPAYHDLLDPPAGYRTGAQLQFMNLDARLYTDNDEFQVEEFVAVEIRSLTPRDAFFHPLSWQVGVGARRTELEDGDRILTPYLDGGAGGSWQVFGDLRAQAMLTGDLEISKHLRQGYDVAPGADLFLLHQSDTGSLATGLRSKAWVADDHHREDELYLQGALHFGRDYSLRGTVRRTHHYERYDTQWDISIHGYF